jgi:hypothetical protein
MSFKMDAMLIDRTPLVSLTKRKDTGKGLCAAQRPSASRLPGPTIRANTTRPHHITTCRREPLLGQ